MIIISEFEKIRYCLSFFHFCPIITLLLGNDLFLRVDMFLRHHHLRLERYEPSNGYFKSWQKIRKWIYLPNFLKLKSCFFMNLPNGAYQWLNDLIWVDLPGYWMSLHVFLFFIFISKKISLEWGRCFVTWIFVSSGQK